MTEAPTTLMALGYDPFPLHLVDRANRALAIAEAKITLLEEGLVSSGELDHYEWVVDQETANAQVPEYLSLVVRVQKRTA